MESIAQQGYPQLMTVDETAVVLRRSPRTIVNMCESGEVKSTKVRGRWLVNRDRLAEQFGIDLGGRGGGRDGR